MVLALVLGASGVAAIVAYGLAGFALAGIVRQFAVGTRARRTAYREVWPVATARAVRANPRLYGGLVVHVGVVFIAVALAASSTASTRRELRLSEGESATVRDVTVTYLGRDVDRNDQKTTVKARIRLERDDDELGVYAPAISTFPGTNQGIGTPSVRTGALRDVYLTLISAPSEKDRVTIAVAINPMIVWLWIGGGVMALGTVLALLPNLRRRRPGTATAGEPLLREPSGAPRDRAEVLA
jgi:cytochrome c-type biogenesis protein CcmF